MMLRVYPDACIPMKVINTDTGIEIAVTRVERIDSRNTRITITAKTSPSRPSVASDSIDCWMKGAWSNTTVSFELLPSAFSKPGMRFRTAWETETVFPSGALLTWMVRAGLPSTREMPTTGSSVS